MSLDLDQVRAFVAAAETGHFRQAAVHLELTQQGLSRRIAALEQGLGVRLFRRRPGGVELTAEGARFLPHAHRLLALASTAFQSVGRAADERPLRVDVWGPACRPLRLLREHVRTGAVASVEVSMRRDSDAALAALRQGEIDVAFVCTTTLPPNADDLDAEIACSEALAAAVPHGHVLAEREVIAAAELGEHGLWWPVHDAPDVSRQVADYAAVHGIPLLTDGRSMGVEFVLDPLVVRTDRVGIYGADWPTDGVGGGVRLVPIEDPGPRLVWSLVWHCSRPHPELDRLRHFVGERRRDRVT